MHLLFFYPFLELSALPNDMLLLGTTRITYNPSTKVIGLALIGRKKMLLEALEVSHLHIDFLHLVADVLIDAYF